MNKEETIKLLREAEDIVIAVFEKNKIGYTERPSHFWKDKNKELLIIEVVKLLKQK
jgi:hypothetical protein